MVYLLVEVAETTPHQANRLRICLSRMYKWLIEHEIVEASPILGVAPRVKAKARSRILSEAELAALWIATERIGSPLWSCHPLHHVNGRAPQYRRMFTLG